MLKNIPRLSSAPVRSGPACKFVGGNSVAVEIALTKRWQRGRVGGSRRFARPAFRESNRRHSQSLDCASRGEALFRRAPPRPAKVQRRGCEFLVSRFPVGSSARMTRGSLAKARATATRCCSPPERWRLGRESLLPRLDGLQQLRRALAHFVFRKAAEPPHRNHDVFLCGEILHQKVELKDESEQLVALARKNVIRQAGKRLQIRS